MKPGKLNIFVELKEDLMRRDKRLAKTLDSEEEEKYAALLSIVFSQLLLGKDQ